MAIMPNLAVGLSLLVCLSFCCEAQLLQRSLSRIESQETSSMRRRLSGDFDDLQAFLRELKTTSHNVQVEKSIKAFIDDDSRWPRRSLSYCLNNNNEEEPELLTACLQTNRVTSIKAYQWGTHEAAKLERKADKLAYRKIGDEWVLAYVRTISQEFNVFNKNAKNYKLSNHKDDESVTLVGELLIYNGKAHAMIISRAEIDYWSSKRYKEVGSLTKGVFDMAKKALPNLKLDKENIESSFTIRHAFDKPVEVTGTALAEQMKSFVTNSDFLIGERKFKPLEHVLSLLAKANDSIDQLFDSKQLEKFGISTTNKLRETLHGRHHRWSKTEPFGKFAIDIPLDGMRNEQLGNDLVARLTLLPKVSVTSTARAANTAVAKNTENSSAVLAAKNIMVAMKAMFEAQRTTGLAIDAGSEVSEEHLENLKKVGRDMVNSSAVFGDLMETSNNWSVIADGMAEDVRRKIGADSAWLLLSSRVSFEILPKTSLPDVMNSLSDEW